MTFPTRSAAGPAILVVRDDPGELGQLLERRFGLDYLVESARSVPAAEERLRAWAADGTSAALLLADPWVGGTPTRPLLASARATGPQALRCWLVPYGLGELSDDLIAALAVGDLDRYLNYPWGHPDVGLYPPVTELLGVWRRTAQPQTAQPVLVQVIGRRWAPRWHELRDLLDRNNVPAAFHDLASGEGDRLLRDLGLPEPPDQPVVVLPGGEVLVAPTNTAIADHLGARTRPSTASADLAIVGGGPAGLASAVYGASEGLRTVLIERSALGGQAGTSSLIRNYLGFPHGTSGTELALRAAEQAWLFGVEFVLTNAVGSLAPAPTGWRLGLTDGATLEAQAVVLATGITYRRLEVPGIAELVGAGVFYGAASSEARGFTGRRVYVVGAGNSAGQAALHLGRHARSVILLVRGTSLAASMSDYLVQEIARTPNVGVRLRTEVHSVHGSAHLERITVHDGRTGRRHDLPADGLFILIGAQPHTGWLPADLQRDDRGFIRTGATLNAWPLTRPPLPFETSLPGVFAVGDVRAGSVKRVASAVGEGAVAVAQVHQYLQATPAPSSAIGATS